jgi:hypothetical protein
LESLYFALLCSSAACLSKIKNIDRKNSNFVDTFSEY